MSQAQSLLGLLPILYKWRKHLIAFVALVAVGSILICLALPNYYRASTTFYAASTDLAKPAPVGQSDRGFNFYGYDEDMDRLFSVARSNAIYEHLIDSFQLYTHYDIDPNGTRAKYKIRKRLQKLYTSLKTKYDAVELSVEDQNPQMAAQMANAARVKIDALSQKLLKDSQQKLLSAYEDNIEFKEEKLRVLNDSLSRVRAQYDIYHIRSQAEVLSELQANTNAKLLSEKARLATYLKQNYIQDSVNYLRAKISGLESQLKGVRKQSQTFNSGMALVAVLEKEQNEMAVQLSLDKERYKQLLAAYNSNFPTTHLIEAAEVPVIKSRPRRSIYVIGATLLAGVLGLFLILAIEAIRQVKWKALLRE